MNIEVILAEKFTFLPHFLSKTVFFERILATPE